MSDVRVWGCANGHEVPRGMFHCPVCGADDVGEAAADRVVAPPPVTRRTEALRELSSTISAGAGLALVGVLLSLGAVASAGSSGPDTGNAVVSLLGNLVLLVGGCFVLVGIVGHGVRLGIEAARPPD